MGRHSRRGPAPRGDDADAAAREGLIRRPGRRRMSGTPAEERAAPAGPVPDAAPREAYAGRPGTVPGTPYDTPSGTTGGLQDGRTGGFPAGAGRVGPPPADGTPPYGFPGIAGDPAGRGPRGGPGGAPRVTDGGSPRTGPAAGGPRFPGDPPAHAGPRVRGGHPEHREAGGGWGRLGEAPGAGRDTPAAPWTGTPEGPGVPLPRQRQSPPGGPPRRAPDEARRERPGGTPRRARAEGPRQEYLDAFDDDDVFAARPPRGPAVSGHGEGPFIGDWSDAPADTHPEGTRGDGGHGAVGPERPAEDPEPAKGAKGRTFTGIAAAAVTTVLAVVVAGQVADGQDGEGVRSRAAADGARDARGASARTDGRAVPPAPEAAPPTYAQRMSTLYPLGADLEGPGTFDAVTGVAKAPGTGRKYTYRVDIERGLGLDGDLFAEAVQKTLNDDRSWAHNGARTFERIHSGDPDFVITLASPGTTAFWCAKSGLDTTEDNVSCDSAATPRVMINAYRWAQGSETYGDRHIHAYRQMLINHEVGHRIGYNHVTCDKDGDLAPVMQQQTKFLDHDGIRCRPNPWAYPGA
ncbi:DUF3152 domain-containing protein [Streptomyces sp. NRRL F-5065]|uniref:DUF3152 domain-containing protein n=1 Tax=Streptomyces sp. NRRL F-5065 TaxID=1463855 RepID=UPI0004C11C47|nr:DUF3152 domain-containing protein [Streptomyces sp. NRRL F-5065]